MPVVAPPVAGAAETGAVVAGAAVAGPTVAAPPDDEHAAIVAVAATTRAIPRAVRRTTDPDPIRVRSIDEPPAHAPIRATTARYAEPAEVDRGAKRRSITAD
jgi:hypothetical protein